MLTALSLLWSWRWPIVGIAFGLLVLWVTEAGRELRTLQNELTSKQQKIESLTSTIISMEKRQAKEAEVMAAEKRAAEARRVAVDAAIKKVQSHESKPLSPPLRDAVDSLRALRRGAGE